LSHPVRSIQRGRFCRGNSAILNCIGSLDSWEFEKGKRELKARVDGQLAFNGLVQRIDAALAGLGLAYLPEGAVQPYLASGRLQRTLEGLVPAVSATFQRYAVARLHCAVPRGRSTLAAPWRDPRQRLGEPGSFVQSETGRSVLLTNQVSKQSNPQQTANSPRGRRFLR